MSSYAPLYTTRERVLMLARLAAFLGPLLLLWKYWFLPWLGEYAEHANCHFYGDLTGVHLLMYGVFVGSPLSLALLVLLLEGRRSLRVLRLGQNPLPGEKVLRRTRYRYGWPARIKPLLLLGCVLFVLGIATWGSFQARELTASVAPCETVVSGT